MLPGIGMGELAMARDVLDSAALEQLLLHREVEQFLYAEAELLDERQFDDWLDLRSRSPGCATWSPTHRTHAEDYEVHVKSRFLVYRNRVQDETDFFVGKREDVLRRIEGHWKIARRKIILDQNVLLAKNVTIFF